MTCCCASWFPNEPPWMPCQPGMTCVREPVHASDVPTNSVEPRSISNIFINKTHLEIAKTWDVSGFLCQNVQSFSRAGRKSLQERFGIDEKIELERDCAGQKDDELQEERRGTADARTVGDKKQTGDVASRKSCQEFDFYHFVLNSVFVYDLHQQYRNRMATYFFGGGRYCFFWGSWFSALIASLLFLLLSFSAFLLFALSAFCFFCFFAFPASLFFCFSAFPASLLFWFLFFLFLCFSCFSASVPFYFYYSTCFFFGHVTVFAALLPAPMLLCFLSLLSLCFSFSFALFSPVCIPNEILQRP